MVHVTDSVKFLEKRLRTKRKVKKRSQNQSSTFKTCWNFSKDLQLRCQFQTLRSHRGYARHRVRFEFQKTSESKFVEDTSEKRTEIYQSRVCHIERNGPRSSKRFSRQIRARRWSASSPNDKLEGCPSRFAKRRGLLPIIGPLSRYQSRSRARFCSKSCYESS